ncbi:MAG: RICIN domain-containing protein [Pseudoxanthomonas sp.]
MRFAKIILLLSCLIASPFANAVVAGGLVAFDHKWPASDIGYLDMDFYLTVTQEPGQNGYTYWANQFWFKGGDGGYIGLQQRAGTTKAVNFSIWKATSWTAESGAQCAYFEHEGNGVQCWIEYQWSQRKKYKLRLVAESLGSWAASVTDIASGQTRKIATIRVPQTWGGLKETTNDFVEDFAQGSDQRASCTAVPATSAVFHRPAAENGTVSPTSSAARITGVCGSIARASCTLEQDCIGSANRFGNVGDPKLLKNENSGNCLDTLAGGERAGLWTCASNNNQRVERDDYFRMLMRARSKCLQAEANNQVKIAACTDSSIQRWIPVGTTNEIYNVGTGKCLDPLNGGVSGAYVQMYSCLANGYQKWKWTP